MAKPKRRNPEPFIDWSNTYRADQLVWVHGGGSWDVAAALRYLARHGMIRRESAGYLPEIGGILWPRPHTTRFRIENPVQYHVNQIVHLADVCAALEIAVLKRG